MSTSAVSNNSDWWKAPTNNDTNTNTKGTNNLGDFNSFMKILAAELQNQDPTDPVSNTEYVAQLAQVETLSQLQSMSNTITNASAYDLIGKSVTYQTTDDSGAIGADTGTVQAVVKKDNETYIMVNGGIVKVSAVLIVAPAPTPTPDKTK